MAVDGPGLRKYHPGLQGRPGQKPLARQRLLLALRRPPPRDHEAGHRRPDRRHRRHRDDLQLAGRLGASQDPRAMRFRHGIPDAQLVLLLLALGRPHRRAGRARHRHHGLGHGRQAPVHCWGVGGRQSRTDAKYGNIWDHFSVVYEYPENVRGYHHCRHWVNTPTQVKDYILGTKGTADVFGNAITGANKWRYRGAEAQHVPGRARRDVRRDPRRQADQQRRKGRRTAPCWPSWAAPPPTPAKSSLPR